jgi:hypothetical protein
MDEAAKARFAPAAGGVSERAREERGRDAGGFSIEVPNLTVTRRAACAVREAHGDDRLRLVQERVLVDGKFLLLGAAPFRLRGVTYGSFGPRGDGELFPEHATVRADFRAMSAAGLNTVRTYTLPPPDVLDAAAEAGLRVLAGLYYHDWRDERAPGRVARRRVLDAGRRAVEAALERCAGRPEVIAFSVGNEVPADLVRLHGISSVEETLSTLVAQVHTGGPDLLATYTNYPTTEYLQVDGQDFASFNVFLESPEEFRSYVRHLQVVAGDLPLVLTELGLAAELHSEVAQADALAWQLRIAEESGCAGVTIFSWTDDWAVNAEAVKGWGFGLTRADREPRAAIDVVSAWTDSDLRGLRNRWPRVSVVVCAHNEEALIGRCLDSLKCCDYPELDVIVCDDGSRDRTAAIAHTFPFRVLTLAHGGLSRARNEGLRAATGDVVAYLDADAECHPEWPYHLALSLEDGIAATGGPNLPPLRAPFTERVVNESPGGPSHVLVSDDRAEHVPGCNMAFRRDVLEEIGGFDPIFTAAGDDVDVCWNLLDAGYEIGFAPVAQVRHHRPATLRTYFRQQRSYGRAERLLQGRHAHRFNRIGQPRWAGSIYGGPRVLPNLLRPVVYHGPMGFAPFQPVTRRRSEVARDRFAALLPFLSVSLVAAALAPLSLWWLVAPGVAVAVMLTYAASIAFALRPARGEPRPLALRLVVAWLHLAQPFVRASGRLRGNRVGEKLEAREWSGDRGEWLRELMRDLSSRRCKIRSADVHDDYDFAVSIGPLVSCRIRTAVAWNWLPRLGVSLQPRKPAWLVFAAGLAVAPFSLWWGVLIVATLAGVAVVEGAVLFRAVRMSVRATTHPRLSERS